MALKRSDCTLAYYEFEAGNAEVGQGVIEEKTICPVELSIKLLQVIVAAKESLMMSDQVPPNVLDLTARIVSAHVSKNPVAVEALPGLIQSVYRSLSTAGEAEAPPAPTHTPAVPIKKSVFPDYIVCLEDGKKLKMLKRHLQTSYGMSPDAYRTKWGLPRDYPMVAPNYAATRSGLAKQIGLGRKAAAEPAPATPPAEPKQTRKPRGAKVAS